MHQETKQSMEYAKQLIIKALEKLTFSHRHKTYMGGCDECAIISNMKTAAEELDKALASG